MSRRRRRSQGRGSPRSRGPCPGSPRGLVDRLHVALELQGSYISRGSSSSTPISAFLMAADGLVLHLHMGVEGDEAVREPGDGVDLRQVCSRAGAGRGGRGSGWRGLARGREAACGGDDLLALKSGIGSRFERWPRPGCFSATSPMSLNSIIGRLAPSAPPRSTPARPRPWGRPGRRPACARRSRASGSPPPRWPRRRRT